MKILQRNFTGKLQLLSFISLNDLWGRFVNGNLLLLVFPEFLLGGEFLYVVPLGGFDGLLTLHVFPGHVLFIYLLINYF